MVPDFVNTLKQQGWILKVNLQVSSPSQVNNLYDLIKDQLHAEKLNIQIQENSNITKYVEIDGLNIRLNILLAVWQPNIYRYNVQLASSNNMRYLWSHGYIKIINNDCEIQTTHGTFQLDMTTTLKNIAEDICTKILRTYLRVEILFQFPEWLMQKQGKKTVAQAIFDYFLHHKNLYSDDEIKKFKQEFLKLSITEEEDYNLKTLIPFLLRK